MPLQQVRRRLPNIRGRVRSARWPSTPSPPHEAAIDREPAGPRFGLVTLEKQFLAGGQGVDFLPGEDLITDPH